MLVLALSDANRFEAIAPLLGGGLRVGAHRLPAQAAGKKQAPVPVASDLPFFSQPLITGVSRFSFSSEIISQPPSRLCKCGKRSVLSTFA
jgi:hypothetical protein